MVILFSSIGLKIVYSMISIRNNVVKKVNLLVYSMVSYCVVWFFGLGLWMVCVFVMFIV